ncbi:hypothetical protein FZ103_15845 [Streptomonospora sp. PA3]|uniref:hypothetical protein n=1 Tax=Streptomonospora sp. PA3 TaxID=2607326 RepID=UPI0012DBD4CA|nr:hypothetical protein [Streptomonospora sp. PA3]MUL42626.1 hypothetical protein [Streptomonospora sp. PA3]
MKPVSPWETVIWIAAAIALVCAVVTALVQEDRTGTWVSLIVVGILAVAAGGERRRVQNQRDRG